MTDNPLREAIIRCIAIVLSAPGRRWWGQPVIAAADVILADPTVAALVEYASAQVAWSTATTTAEIERSAQRCSTASAALPDDLAEWLRGRRT